VRGGTLGGGDGIGRRIRQLGWSLVFLLAIDTSTRAVVAAVVTADLDVVAARSPVTPRGHGELLAPAIAECLEDAGIAAREIGAVVAGVGPGPYTSLRIGLVTAAAFADAIGVPTYGVCSLDAITSRGEGQSIVVTDARRHEVYWARYRNGEREDGPHVDRPDDVPLDGVTAIAGAGIDLAEWHGLLRLPQLYPDPVSLVRLALGRIRSGSPSEPLTPLYLRRPDAVVPGAPKPVSQ
jgi:tRNA threonylcarbamoyl adenosine modification protein YeaZ